MSKVKLGDYIESYGDGIHGTPIYDDNGEYYFINGNNLINGEIYIDNNTLRISEKEYKKIKRNLGTNTLLLSINGTLGRIAEYKGEKIALGKSACYLNIKLGENKYFVKYIMSTKEFQKYILLVAHGSTIKNLAPSQVVDYEFELLEKLEPNKIASLLKTIDDKINNNNKINAELEAMSKTLYDYWFLQFEFPNKEGKPYKSSGGKMVWNEELKREIPEGWEVENIFECMDVVYGVPLSTELFDACKGTPVIRIRDIPNNTTSAFTTEEFDNKFLSKNKDLLIGMDGNFHMNFWATEGDCINQRIVRIRDKKEISALQIFYEIRPYIKAKEQNVARSTVGHLSDKDLKALYILNSHDENIYRTFDKLLSLICKNKKENQELAELRDFLLPLLMNGQVGFKEQ